MWEQVKNLESVRPAVKMERSHIPKTDAKLYVSYMF